MPKFGGEPAKIDVEGPNFQQFFYDYSEIKLKINWEPLVPKIDELGTQLM